MYAFISIVAALFGLVVLLRFKVNLGVAMVLSGVSLAVLLGVMPVDLWQVLKAEWNDPEKGLTDTTGYIFVSLSALLLLVNVLGKAMKETGVSDRLLPALQGLFKSRRFALALIPFMMGMLPTPGGIMLSAPMVRDAGDKMGIGRSRLAAINFYFRHQWESAWPLFPAIYFCQTLFDVPILTLISYNIILPAAGVIGGIVGLLLVGIPAKKDGDGQQRRSLGAHLTDFAHSFWPIVLAASLYVGLKWPPAVGILLSVFGFLAIHKVGLDRWSGIFRAAAEPDKVLLIFGAMLFKVVMEAAGAIPEVVTFFTDMNMPVLLLIFFLPFFVAVATGLNLVTAMITFPLLLEYIGTGGEMAFGLEVLAFSGLLCGVLLTPVHLCLALSMSYFDTTLTKILSKMLIPLCFIATAGIVMALIFR
ncbi:MAG: DUF401 family protein [Planctomycetes bacterium]|nr:DUF401 family protein [Planctomycetota bacterium]